MRKDTFLWAALAAGLVILIAVRFDRKAFLSESLVSKIRDDAGRSVSESKALRERIAKLTLREDPDQYTLTDPALIPQSDDGGQAQTTALRVTGIMKTSDGTVIAVVNGSLVSQGSRFRGCEVLHVTEKGVRFNIAGETVTVPLHGEHILEKILSDRLTLEKVISGDGMNTAIINGQFYKAGDWVDGDTTIKAVTPQLVLLDRAGARIYLRVGESL